MGNGGEGRGRGRGGEGKGRRLVPPHMTCLHDAPGNSRRKAMTLRHGDVLLSVCLLFVRLSVASCASAIVLWRERPQRRGLLASATHCTVLF